MRGALVPFLVLLDLTLAIELSVDDKALLRREVINGETNISGDALNSDETAAGATTTFNHYRFVVEKTQGEDLYGVIAEVMLNAQTERCREFFFEPEWIDEGYLLRVQLTDEDHKDMTTWYDPVRAVDGNLYGQTDVKLHINQAVKLTVRPGTAIQSYCFKTSFQEHARDPVSWSFEGSMDGVNWELLSWKTDYHVTDYRQANVGPFIVSHSGWFMNDRKKQVIDMTWAGPRPFYVKRNTAHDMFAQHEVEEDHSGHPESPPRDIRNEALEPPGEVDTRVIRIPDH